MRIVSKLDGSLSTIHIVTLLFVDSGDETYHILCYKYCQPFVCQFNRTRNPFDIFPCYLSVVWVFSRSIT